jgi:pimeloyl-ACP methyl ester carboxylesterase
MNVTRRYQTAGRAGVNGMIKRPFLLRSATAALLAGCLLAVIRPACADEAQRRTVIRGGSTIEYIDHGTGPVILAVPSLGRGAEDFNELARLLSQHGFRVIAPEPPGLGRSVGSMASPTLHDFAADLAALIEDAGLGRVVVLGHAYGNTVARTLATDHPDLVRGIILLAASGRAPIGADVRTAIARSSDMSIPPSDRLPYLQRSYFAAGNDATIWLKGWYPDLQALQWQAFAKSKPGDYVAAGGKAPILDIQGDQDVLIPREYSQDLRRELGERVTVVVVANAGHALVPEQPAAIAAAIESWMTSLNP